MKTRNNQTGNRNNRFTQVLLRAAAVLVSVVLLSFTVSAQDLWKELLTYNSFGKVALIMVDDSNLNSEKPAPAATTEFVVNEEADAPAAIQEWMSSDSYFHNYADFNEVATDEPAEIENWMTDASYFNGRFAAEPEKELELQAWMCDSNFFNRK